MISLIFEKVKGSTKLRYLGTSLLGDPGFAINVFYKNLKGKEGHENPKTKKELESILKDRKTKQKFSTAGYLGAMGITAAELGKMGLLATPHVASSLAVKTLGSLGTKYLYNKYKNRQFVDKFNQNRRKK